MSHTAQRAALTRESMVSIQTALRSRGLAGWLLYDFHGTNPVAGRLLGLPQPLSRRYFAWIPAQGEAIVLAHAIELAPWAEWPGSVRGYRSRRDLERELRALLAGQGPIALEYVARGALPSIDRVPGGLLDLLRESGAELVSSAELVTLFHARWSAGDLSAHRDAAARLAEIARAAFEEAARAIAGREPLSEWSLKEWILRRLSEAGLHDTDTIVAAGPNSADPHYEPAPDRQARIEPNRVLLIDLWGRVDPRSVFADQTWMGYTGTRPPAEVCEVWSAVRDARDHAIAFLRERWAAGGRLRGCDVDRAARAFLNERGYGEAFLHRTGHSIDRELHGSGPNLDSLETEDTRTLEPHTGFSVEPGIYLEGRFGVRSEANVALTEAGVEVTPAETQAELWTV